MMTWDHDVTLFLQFYKCPVVDDIEVDEECIMRVLMMNVEILIHLFSY